MDRMRKDRPTSDMKNAAMAIEPQIVTTKTVVAVLLRSG